MIRILIFLSWVMFFAFALTLVVTLKSAISLEAFGWRADLPAGAAIIIAAVATALVSLLISLIKDVAAAPKAARVKREIDRREKGLAAITRGLEAIALGDGAAARREAVTATRALKEAPVAKLLAAQAAQLTGDDAAAGEALAGLLDAPETEFLALRGLYAKAMRSGDVAAAEGYASRAFALRPKARWAFDALLSLALERSDYRAARETLLAGEKAKTVDRAAAARGAAATFAASAYASHLAGDEPAALEDAEAALKRAPGLAPAAVLAARLLAPHDAKKAARRLCDAFAVAPDPALVEALEAIVADGAPEARAAELDRLAMKNPDAAEAAYARARAALLRGEADTARDELKSLLATRVSAQALGAMAQAEEALRGPVAARIWLERAAAAPRDGALSADAFFRITGEGWRRIVLEYMEAGRLAPPSLEAPPPGLEPADLPALAPPDEEALAIAPPDPTPLDAAPEGDAPSETEIAEEPIIVEAQDDPDTDEMLDREASAARGVS